MKNKYFVSVQARTILPNEGDAAYELEIEATPEQAGQLNELFELMEEEDNDTYLRLHNPAVVYQSDNVTEPFSQSLQDVYRKIYELGTPETRSHIKSMHIIDVL
jgi:hypothetical protein